MKQFLAMLLLAALALALTTGALAATYLYATGDVNLRTGPGLEYDIVLSVKKGAKMSYNNYSEVDGRGVTWYYVYCNGRNGYVSELYTSFSQGGSHSNGYKGGTVYADDGDTHVRSGPGPDYADLGTLKQGNSLTYLGTTTYDDRGVAWYAVSYQGKTGWVSSRYTTLYGVPDYYDDDADYVCADGGDSNVRSGPGLGYGSLGVLKEGHSAPFEGQISYDDRGVAWYSVEYEGYTGWVSSRYASLY